MKKLIDDAIRQEDGSPFVVGHYFTKRGAMRASRRYEEWIRLHPGDAKGLPRARHRVV